jgi:hypothetical protein
MSVDTEDSDLIEEMSVDEGDSVEEIVVDKGQRGFLGGAISRALSF